MFGVYVLEFFVLVLVVEVEFYLWVVDVVVLWVVVEVVEVFEVCLGVE